MGMSQYIANLRAKIGTDLIMTPGVTAIILNEQGEVLLQKRSDNLLWGMPGGAIDPGEDPADAVVREVREETGLEVVPERVIGVYGGKEAVVTYPNGDQVAVISILFLCRIVGGALQPDGDETLELRYFPTDQLPSQMLARHAARVLHAVRDNNKAVFRFQGEWYS
jgi:8-oxo-dGTP pyrophosphatase MutT (NUDIX family)